MFNELRKLRKLKELSMKIDKYQMEIISIGGYPSGDKELQKEIVGKLEKKMKEALQEYNELTNAL